MGMIMGARELRATTVTPARRGPPRCRYLSFLLSKVRIKISERELYRTWRLLQRMK